MGADFLGNFFHHVSELFPQSNQAERYRALSGELLAFYDEFEVSDKLDCLTPNMIENKTGYKIRCSAAKCRALVPFAWKLAQEMLSEEDPVQSAIRQCAYHLHMVYSALSSATVSPSEIMREHSTKFALLYVSLHDILNVQGENPKVWRIKPKLHLFLHVCSEGSIPARTWTYRDEDFGGSVAKAARRRGGLLRPQATSSKVLWCFVVQCPAVRVV